MLDAGLELDREIARKLNGDVKPRPAPYSTSDTAAGRLLRRLAMDGIASTVEALDGQWYCTLWRGAAGRGGRLSTGSGPTRPLAIARAVLHGRLEAGEPVRASDAHRLLLRGFARPAEGRSSCSCCGVELPVRARRRTERFCGVCSWNRTKSRLDARDSPASPRSRDRGAGPL
ncbi:MAG: hypothetical protein M3S32_06755 [Acidobacteriota bacterium]|nr:hypothetical protein [Acidobacteriota bacterium]